MGNVYRFLVGSIIFGLGLFESPFVLLGIINIWIYVFGSSFNWVVNMGIELLDITLGFSY